MYKRLPCLQGLYGGQPPTPRAGPSNHGLAGNSPGFRGHYQPFPLWVLLPSPLGRLSPEPQRVEPGAAAVPEKLPAALMGGELPPLPS